MNTELLGTRPEVKRGQLYRHVGCIFVVTRVAKDATWADLFVIQDSTGAQ